MLRELQQECSHLKSQLSEKEELVQTLINQQLKRENAAVTDHDLEVSRDLTPSSEAHMIRQLQSEVERLQDDVDIHLYEITEHVKEIAMLKDRCEARGQKIESLEAQNQNLIEKANKLEIDFRTKAEENESLRQQLEGLKHEESTLCDGDSDAADGNGEEQSNPHSVLVTLRLQIKQLNDDVTRMKEHSREQSRQILEYRQQADMTKVSILQSKMNHVWYCL